MRKKYQAPSKEFFRLPNNISDVPMTPIQFTIYAYLVCCAGSKGYCWPSIKTISDRTGISKTSVNEHLKVLAKRQIIEIGKQKRPGSAYKKTPTRCWISVTQKYIVTWMMRMNYRSASTIFPQREAAVRGDSSLE